MGFTSILERDKILHKGNKVTIIQEVTNDQGEKWYEIEYDNRLGYVLSKYVKAE